MARWEVFPLSFHVSVSQGFYIQQTNVGMDFNNLLKSLCLASDMIAAIM